MSDRVRLTPGMVVFRPKSVDARPMLFYVQEVDPPDGPVQMRTLPLNERFVLTQAFAPTGWRPVGTEDLAELIDQHTNCDPCVCRLRTCIGDRA